MCTIIGEHSGKQSAVLNAAQVSTRLLNLGLYDYSNSILYNVFVCLFVSREVYRKEEGR